MILLLACASPSAIGSFVVHVDDGVLSVENELGKVLVEDLRFAAGNGDASFSFSAGAYLVEDEASWTELTPGRARGNEAAIAVELLDGDGDELATAAFTAAADRVLRVEVSTAHERVRWDAACTGDDAFAGLGSHVDVDHAGEAFPLWVSEPGIGKTDDDDPPEDWFLTGTKHATSFPDPFLVRPEPMGLAVATESRIEVDLCTSERWRLDVWDPTVAFLVFDGETPLEIVEGHALAAGTPALPPDWAFAPWNDAVGGEERVREVASALRGAGAPSSVLWTEDWKGGEETSFGYRLLPSWDVDTTLYPDAASLDAELAAAGFQWFAYFAPFVSTDSDNWDEASDFVVQTEEGGPYTFTGVDFSDTSVLDLTNDDARQWALEKMAAAVALGFDGWMADYGEWIPPDAVLEDADAVDHHNAYPGWWQGVNAEALADVDGTFFSRSGWTGTTTVSPVTWAGDQRTSFDADDGFPTVVPLGLGAGIAGVPMFAHDIGGYQSVGNEPSTKELWFRWCALGAFTPVMRTHHGAFLAEDWQFDSDEETLAHFARYAGVHTALFPYLRGLAEKARSVGTPLVLAPFLVFPDEPWGRTDAWMLGPSLLVAPVTEEGATGRDVELPEAPAWYDWWTGDRAASGRFDAALDAIPVFARAGAIVPTLTTIPDTLVAGPLDDLVTLSDVDGSRTLRVFAGASGSFTEADGTTYTTDGVATGSGTATASLTSGELEAGGLTLEISGDVERTYVLEVWGPASD